MAILSGRLLWIIFVIYVSSLPCFLVFSLQPCSHRLGKGWPLGSLVCDVSCVFVTFPCVVLGQVYGTCLYRLLIFASLLFYTSLAGCSSFVPHPVALGWGQKPSVRGDLRWYGIDCVTLVLIYFKS